jgi:hypothetical protein
MHGVLHDGREDRASQAMEALIKFDRMLRRTEEKGVAVVNVSALRVAFDSCLDSFQVKAAQLKTWDMEVL